MEDPARAELPGRRRRGSVGGPSHRLAEPTHVREQMLDNLAAAAALNRHLLDVKGRPLNRLLVAAAVETVLVAAAVIASLA